MKYRWIAFLALIGLPGLASAQEASEGKAKFLEGKGLGSLKGELEFVDATIYQIDLLIVEGDVTAFEQAAERSAVSRDLPKPIASLDASAPVSSPAEALDARLRATSPPVLPHPVPEATMKVDPVRLLDLVPAAPNIDVLAAPRLSVVANQEATVQVGSRATFEYLEPAGDDTFRLRRSEPYDLGILLKVTVAPAEDDPDAVVISPLQIEVTSLDGREPVKGIGLEVGKPIVSSRSLKTTVRAPLGEERILAIPSGPEREAGMILRVTRMEDEEEPEPKRSGSGELNRARDKERLKLEASPAR